MTMTNEIRMKQLLDALPTAEAAAKHYADMLYFYARRVAAIREEIELIKRDNALRDDIGIAYALTKKAVKLLRMR